MQNNCRILEVLACLGLPSTGRVSRLLPGLARFTLTNAFIIGKVRAVPQLAKDSLAGLSQDCFHCLQEVVTVIIMIAVSTVTAKSFLWHLLPAFRLEAQSPLECYLRLYNQTRISW